MVMTVEVRRGVRLTIALASTAVLGVGASAPAAYAANGHHGDDNGNRKLSASLTGGMEVPGPGDADGRGTAQIKFKKGQICYKLSWRNIEAPTAAHIHEAPPGEAGPVVVPLPLINVRGVNGAAPSRVHNCVDAPASLIADIQENPGDYYVNIHNATFPGGAIRGQLHS